MILRPSRALPPEQLERRILHDTLQALSDLEWRGGRACFVGRRTVGKFRSLWGEQVWTFGTAGQADIAGFLATGRALEVETKTVNGRLEPEQERWRDFCLSMNVLWILSRDAQVACQEVLAALEGA